MSKRKSAKSTTPKGSGTGREAAPSQPVGAKKRATGVLWGVMSILIAGLIGLLVWVSRQPATVTQPLAQPVEPTVPATPFQPITTPRPEVAMGAVGNCGRLPAFPEKFGFTSKTVIASTSERMIMGLVIYDPNNPPQVDNPWNGVYQHPTWDDAGYLGHFLYTESGDIYVFPAPRESLEPNPPEKQNILYRVDGQSGEMKAWLELPSEVKPSPENPFGILGVAYDCDSRMLYVASVFGSTRSQEIGRFYQISVEDGKIISTYENVDAMGMSVYSGSTGKRLYFGSARTPEVRSIALDPEGKFFGEPRLDLSLGGLGPGGDDRARRVKFGQDGTMTVVGFEFNFTLRAVSEQRQTEYKFMYDKGTDKWSYVEGA